jgi:Taurine catabolism dioxygenase TauD, TfdA family
MPEQLAGPRLPAVELSAREETALTEPAYLPFLHQALRYFNRPHAGPALASVASPAAWKSRDIESAPWRVRLGSDEVGDLRQAVAAWQAGDAPLADLTVADFPLPRLASKIAAWRAEVATGRGFQVISGVPVEEWSVEESSIFFWGLGQHLGRPGAQNRKGDLLGHVRDTGADRHDRYVRQYLTTQNIPFHCDAADMVGLLCLRSAKSGGLSRIASSVSVYNELLRRRPDLAPRLFEPFMLDTRDEAAADGTAVLPVTPCRYDGRTLRTFWHSDYFRSSERHSGVHLTPTEHELLDLYDEIAASPEFHVDMELEPGDVQLLSNHTVIHARTDYVDHLEEDRKRHLLRLWITF